jgi:hypothetical protein
MLNSISIGKECTGGHGLGDIPALSAINLAGAKEKPHKAAAIKKPANCGLG